MINTKSITLKKLEMKKFFAVIMLVLVLFSCKEKEKKEIEMLKQKVEQLQQENITKDSTINQFFQVLNEIEDNLAIIKEKERIIAKNAAMGNELKGHVRDRINEDIQLINELMAKNKQSIRGLSQQIKDSNIKAKELMERIDQTSRMLEERDVEISLLKERLTQLNFSVEVLNAAIDTLSREKELLIKEVENKIDLLNMAWYSYGTKKELTDNAIIEKAGGFLGLGKTIKLRSDFNEDYFTKIDITQTASVPLFAKKATLITSHPTGSYSFVENEAKIIEKLEITDVEKFWSASKYLVILVE